MPVFIKKYHAFILTALLCIFAEKTHAFDSLFVAKNGVIDLRTADFNKAVSLEGQWSFAWNKLVEPDSAESLTSFTQFPKLWNGEQPNAIGYASYGLHIILPKDHSPLALQLPVAYSSYKLFLNGKVIATNGKVDSIEKNYQPQWIPVTVEIPLHIDTARLLLQVANFSHSKGGPNLKIMMGKASNYF